jgi:LacI family transcriptional regulator
MTGVQRRVTRDEVARLAGTSTAVVSYVINNGPRPVSESTRNKVLAAIEQTRYRPNGIAKALAAGSSRTYGLIVPDISNPFFAAIAHAVEDEIFDAGMVLLLGDSAESKEREEEILSIFQQQQIDGLLFIGTDNHPHVQTMARAGTPVVVLDRIDEDDLAASVVVDNVAGAIAATRHLIGHGYTEIAFVGGPEGLSTSEDRHAGWMTAMREAALEVNDDWHLVAPYSKAGGLDAGRRLLAQSRLPRAIFAANDQQAIGILRVAYEGGIRVPEDLAIITFDGTTDAEFSAPPLSTIRQPIEEIAKSAVWLLLNPDADGSNRITCQFELVLRRSCGCTQEKNR